MQTLQTTKLNEQQLRWPEHMQSALDAARRVLTASPNPRVGCVIVANAAGPDDEVLGLGWHSGEGLAHAEVEALAEAGELARGATAFVTLEPCCHTGRTGPCCLALVEAGIRRVVIAMRDSNPKVAGGGIAALEAAGVDVFLFDDFERDARSLNSGFFSRIERGRPFLRCKLAMSIDGRTALQNGASKWITGAAARADVQRLRAQSDAIVTGIGTVLADDPALTVRRESLPFTELELERNAIALQEQPLRIVLDSQARLSADAKIVTEPGRCIAYVAHDTEDKTPAYERRVHGASERVDLRSVLNSLAQQDECNEVLLEAGAILSSAFIEAGLVDELIIYIAPKLLGSDARSLLALSGLTQMSDAIEFEIAELTQIAEDIKVVLRPKSVSGKD